MVMPKGFKTKNGYATAVNRGGMNYRQIAENMTESGCKMNHSTARNIFLSAMNKVAQPICKIVNTAEDPNSLSRNPDFQLNIAEIIDDIYGE